MCGGICVCVVWCSVCVCGVVWCVCVCVCVCFCLCLVSTLTPPSPSYLLLTLYENITSVNTSQSNLIVVVCAQLIDRSLTTLLIPLKRNSY